MLAVSSGSYILLVSTLLSALAMIVVRWRISAQPKLTEQTMVRVFDSRIWLDDYRLPRGSVFWSREQFDFVWQRLSSKNSTDVVENFAGGNFQLTSGRLAVALGFNSQQVVEVSLVDDGPHSILIGATGSGKTELLKQILSCLQSGEETELVLIDFKGGSGLGQFSSSAKALVTDRDLEATKQLVEFLSHELETREQNQQKPPPLVIVIDELAHLLQVLPAAEKILTSIAARGRSASMHLLLTNQNLVGIPRALLSNIKLRILIGQSDPVDAALLGQIGRPETPPPTNRRLASAQLVGHGQAPRQFWYLLPAKPEPAQLKPTPVSEPGLRLRSIGDPREYLARELMPHRRGRHRANRDLPASARREASR